MTSVQRKGAPPVAPRSRSCRFVMRNPEREGGTGFGRGVRFTFLGWDRRPVSVCRDVKASLNRRQGMLANKLALTFDDAYFRPMGPANGMSVTFRLASVLEATNLSQRELARRSGVSLVTINAIANNRTTRVDLDTLDKLCEVLDVTPGELLEREEPKRRRGR